ncbi:hypothetical protein KEU06_12325 [Pseudaminobacter sp. 19-2017]|uniref:Uncharacterized protein n=1 Tax=Pseudaminobacter soli (ex Zhang et al. 2022) TaxID=2831468 RepID=A0A942E2H2_9HYPH|nr:hypothetical protein [Pseudaminobacter soli]MBS3649395.1 hypothetical protein [Pseudaminobacter soli]
MVAPCAEAVAPALVAAGHLGGAWPNCFCTALVDLGGGGTARRSEWPDELSVKGQVLAEDNVVSDYDFGAPSSVIGRSRLASATP